MLSAGGAGCRKVSISVLVCFSSRDKQCVLNSGRLLCTSEHISLHLLSVVLTMYQAQTRFSRLRVSCSYDEENQTAHCVDYNECRAPSVRSYLGACSQSCWHTRKKWG